MADQLHSATAIPSTASLAQATPTTAPAGVSQTQPSVDDKERTAQSPSRIVPQVSAGQIPAGQIPPAQDVLSVNFLRDQRSRFNKQIEKDKVIAKYAAWAVVVFMLILIGVVTVEVLLTIQQNKITTSITQTTSRLSGLSTLEQEYLVFAQKLKLMYALDSARAAKQEATSYFYALIPTTNILKSVTTDNDQSKQTITFTIESPDVFGVLALLQLFSAQSVTDKGYVIQSQDLSRASDGTYTVAGSLDYSQAANMKKSGATGG